MKTSLQNLAGVILSFISISCASGPKATQTQFPATAPAPVNSAESKSKPYVILVSIDGYRPDYTGRFHAKNIAEIIKVGASSKSMIPSFPSKTFPNHLTLVTGKYPENHGIVANSFYDLSRPEGDNYYQIGNPKAVTDGTWYQAKPIWVTAQEQGMLTACFFWPGSEAQISGLRPLYFTVYNAKIPNEERVKQVLDWLALPEETRPHFITLYFSDVDSAGHAYGTESEELKKAVQKVDENIGVLRKALLNLPLPVSLVIVSDHGMQNLDPKKIVYLDDQADFSGFLVGDQGPQLSIYKDPKQPSVGNLEELYKKLKENAKGYQVYRRAEIPRHYHYSNNPRIGDLLLIAESPYSLGLRSKNFHIPKATHGYDPFRYPSMHASFFAEGPMVRHERIPSFENIHLYPFLMELLELKMTEPVDGNAQVLHRLLKR